MNSILYGSIYSTMLVNVRVYATDASKTLLPWKIFIALRVSRLLYCSAVLYIQNNTGSSYLLCNLLAVALLKGSGESKVNEIHQRLMRFICNT